MSDVLGKTFDNLKKENQDNIVTLWIGLRNMYGRQEFHTNFAMSPFQNPRPDINEARITKHNEYTSACVLGHGPIFGLIRPVGSLWKRLDKYLDLGYPIWNWGKYSLSFFGLTPPERSWEFIFSSRWDNNIQEAITRLNLFIEGFNPETENWDYSDRYVAGVVKSQSPGLLTLH